MAQPQAGETWAYRIGRKLGRKLTPVEVVQVLDKRVIVCFQQGSQTGKAEEVPIGRLQFPWDEVRDGDAG